MSHFTNPIQNCFVAPCWSNDARKIKIKNGKSIRKGEIKLLIFANSMFFIEK